MKRKILLRILFGAVAFALLLVFLISVIVEPWVGRKIQTAFNKNSADYLLKIEQVHFSILKSGIALENITLISKQELNGIPILTGEIASVNFIGINLRKAIFQKDMEVREVNIFNSRMIGKLPFPEKPNPPKISTLNIRIDSMFFDKLVVELKSTSTAQSYSVHDGILKIYDVKLAKMDTVSPRIFKQFDFDALELLTVSSDSMYTYAATGINYSATSTVLAVDSLSIHPNYSKAEFAALHEFQTNRFEAGLSQILFNDFSAAEYLKSGNLISSSIEIGELELNVFRDKRIKFRHTEKPTFQDMLYNYRGRIDIDSIGIRSGNIIYTEHAEKANEPGMISFNEIAVGFYKITNDTVYKTEKAYLGFNAEAMLMGKAKLNVLLKSKLFDPQNIFTVNGSLSAMEISELNPILEKSASINVTSGKIDAMNFNFTANNTNACGQMNLRYHGLNVAVKNRRTDDTTAIKERIISVIANLKIADSNPSPGEELRIGIIDQERDTERFFIHYSFRSILSGIKTTIVKSPKKKD